MNPSERLSRKNAFDGYLVYGTARFNRSTGRDRQFASRDSEASQYVDDQTGKLKEELAAHRKCPVCAGDATTIVFTKEGFDHHRCRSCGMTYVNPVLRPDLIGEFYRNEDPWNQVLASGPQRELDSRKFEYFLDLIETHRRSRGALLDVGCGPGLFLEVARSRGWDVAGVEFNEQCVARLRTLGIPVVDRPLDQAGVPPNTYSCVTAWDVLEHIENPREFLATVAGMLVPGGILGLAVPNVDGLVNRILHEKARTFGGHAHINLFGPKTLGQLLEASGFVVVECETYLTELGSINNYLSYEDPYFGQATDILGLTPEDIHQRLLGSRLLILARLGNA